MRPANSDAEHVTPFSVLGLLRDIEHNDGLAPTEKRELAASIDRPEQHYFAAASEAEPDLRQIAASWVERTNRR